MGVVFMADQGYPIRRKVALKIIKPGMDSRQVIARFEADAPGAGDDGAPEYRQGPRCRRHRGGPALLRHGAGPRRTDHRVLRPGPTVPARAVGTPRAGLPGDPARASEGDHSPRHQAVEHPGVAVRRPAGAQGHRFRRGQGDRATVDRTDALHPARGDRRDSGIHEPRAGREQRPGHRHAHRRLRPGRAAVRAADRDHAPGAAAVAEDPVCGDRSANPRGRVAEAERAALEDRAARRDRGAAGHGTPEAGPAGPRRAGLDRDEGAGEGPHAPVRHGQRPGPRSPALPGRRAAGSRTAFGAVPAREVRAQNTARPW